jgi:hypothetical protein
MTEKEVEHMQQHEQVLMRLLERATAERRQLRAEIDSLKRQRTTDRYAIAEYLHRAMSDFLQNTIQFQMRETPEGYVVEKEIVGAWWKAANTDYGDLDEDDKYLYICDADAIISLHRDPNEYKSLYIPETDTIILPSDQGTVTA